MRKLMNFRVPVDLLERMERLRENEGISVTFQFVKGAEMYLEAKKQRDEEE